jgi:tRNA-dihydrouridine synthase A
MTAPLTTNPPSRRFCIAPMMDWTDRHCRYFLRLLSQKTLLYSEMVTTGALLHGDWHRHLRYDAAELPLALQLGGSDPSALAACARMAEAEGYSEVNLNVGCPSDRVQNNMIGACLMAAPALVAECVAAMRAAVRIPVTVKCRIGIDAMDSDEQFAAFIDSVASGSGCSTFIVHARIAILQGLSPKENREIPPLNYPRVHRIKQQFPHLEIVINGGIRSIDEALAQLQLVNGVMVGREAYQNPWLLHDVDQRLFGIAATAHSRESVLQQFLPYISAQLRQGVALQHMSRHILGLFHGQPGGKQFRRVLSEQAHRPDAGIDTLLAALAATRRHHHANSIIDTEAVIAG